MYVIDGYNLMHALCREIGMSDEDPRARAVCVERLAMLARRENRAVRIFFDGDGGDIGRGDHAFHNVFVRFCGHERESADRAVREFVENAIEPRKLVVVSSDIEVKEACRLTGARVAESRVLARRLAGGDGASAPEPDEKPRAGHMGRAEREMLEEIGDFEEFRRSIEEDG